jgi:ABC-type Fe3+-citrate transport system substrate-binding protein
MYSEMRKKIHIFRRISDLILKHKTMKSLVHSHIYNINELEYNEQVKNRNLAMISICKSLRIMIIDKQFFLTTIYVKYNREEERM